MGGEEEGLGWWVAVETRREDRVVRVSFHRLFVCVVSLSVHAVSPLLPSTMAWPVIVCGWSGRRRQFGYEPVGPADSLHTDGASV